AARAHGREPRDASARPSRRVRVPRHRRGARRGGRAAARGADGRSPNAAGRARAPAGRAGGAGRQPLGVRRSRLPADARDLRRPGGADRDAGGRRGAAASDSLAAPARVAAAVDGGRDRVLPNRRGAHRRARLMHNRWHPDLEPAFRVKPGAELRLECQDGIAGQLGPDSTHDDVSLLDLGLAHPLTGPVFVEGADPGDTLCVDFLAYEPDSFGATPIVPGFGFLADLFPAPYLVKWRMAGGRAISDELPGVAVPGDPFAGVVGVAPSRERMEEFRAREERIRAAGGPVADAMPETAIPSEAADGLRTIPPREIGGNVDIRQLVAGSTLFLPVDVPGALFSIGDLHFAQGDGEV